MHRAGVETKGLIRRSCLETGKIDVFYDAELAIIRIRTEGLWSPDQIDCHFDNLIPLIASMRRDRHRVRILVDRRDTLEQEDATNDRLRARTELSYEPTDRIAVIVDNSLTKIQARGSLDGQTHRLFVSEAAAMMWLRAYD